MRTSEFRLMVEGGRVDSVIIMRPSLDEQWTIVVNGDRLPARKAVIETNFREVRYFADLISAYTLIRLVRWENSIIIDG